MSSLSESIYYSSPAWLQNALVSAYGYRLYRKRYSGIYHNIFQLVRESRNWSPAQIEAYQSERLFHMIKHCRANIPYYQNLFAEYGLSENNFTTTEDITRLPVLSKQTLRGPSDLFRMPSVRPYIVQHTSGSTGTPLALDVNEYTYKMAMALLVEHEEFHGVPFGARRATFAGRMIQPAKRMKPPFARMNISENQMLFSSYHLNSQTFHWYREKLDKFQPKELIGYPSAIADLATYYKELNCRPNFKPKAIITNSESLLAWQREQIENTFQCSVFDYYGSAEYIIFSGQNRDGDYQTNPLLGITEIIPPSDKGDFGRIIASTLTNTSMPLLRYDLGDTGELDAQEKYCLGSPSFKNIEGRIDEYIETADGRQLGRIDHIFKGVNGIKEAQVVQKEPGSATIRVNTDHSNTFNENALIHNCQKWLGNDFRISIEHVDEIPRGRNGKFRAVIKE